MALSETHFLRHANHARPVIKSCVLELKFMKLCKTIGLQFRGLVDETTNQVPN